MTKPQPRLPPGTPSTLSGLSETFSFHSSPESFIASRILALAAQNQDPVASRFPIHAKILNRDVAVISSHAHIAHVLGACHDQGGPGDDDDRPTYVAAAAYEPFMAPFFPRPNVVLVDGECQVQMRCRWEHRISSLKSNTATLVKGLTRNHFEGEFGQPINLYASLKALSWKIMIGLFLNIEEHSSLFGQIQALQEDLLRGQFSVFPVSVDLSIWKSPRKKGIEASTKLQKLIADHLRTTIKSDHCPYSYIRTEDVVDDDMLLEITNHILLATSSLAVKSLASLLTAFLLNIFLHEDREAKTYDRLIKLQLVERKRILRSIGLETERLSPPIAGIMRRTTREDVIPVPDKESPDILIPKGWDVWLYFVGGGRDTDPFGPDSGHFVPDRFLSEVRGSDYEGLGLPVKTCLAKELSREIYLAVAMALLDMGVKLEGNIPERGVRGWLGWEDSVSKADSQDWARDMRQLPTQHPSRPVWVHAVAIGNYANRTWSRDAPAVSLPTQWKADGGGNPHSPTLNPVIILPVAPCHFPSTWSILTEGVSSLLNPTTISLRPLAKQHIPADEKSTACTRRVTAFPALGAPCRLGSTSLLIPFPLLILHRRETQTHREALASSKTTERT